MLQSPFSFKKMLTGRNRIIMLIAGLFLLLYSKEITAQKEWAVTLKPGVNIPTEQIAGTDLSTGFGVEGTISYEFSNFLTGYGGWGWNKFSAEHSFAGDDIDFEETGYTFGIQFNYPTTITKVTYMLSVG